MDVLLGRLTQQAMSMAIRSGVSIATAYMMKNATTLLNTSPKSQERAEIAELQARLEIKVRIISPAIDLIELITARGHTSLESALVLTKDIRASIQDLGRRLQATAEQQDLVQQSSKRISSEQLVMPLKRIIVDMQSLITKIDDSIPLISLAITTSGTNLSSPLSSRISPSRLLQASTFLTAADSAYMLNVGVRAQVGPTFVVSLYMLFAGHASRAVNENDVRDTTWKEVLHKASVKLLRVENETDGESPYFSYRLLLIEDLSDDRVHTYEEDEAQPGPYDGVDLAGIRESIPVHEISKLFYVNTCKILGIDAEGEENCPVLLLKRDQGGHPQTQDSLSQTDSADRNIGATTSWHLPADLDPEWLALQVYTAEDDAEEDSEVSRSSLSGALSALSIQRSTPTGSSPIHFLPDQTAVQTSLSLLKMLIKLAALQQFRQESHLSIEDELLNFFLEASATAGTGADKARRGQARQHAVQRVGFDPYDESPVKRGPIPFQASFTAWRDQRGTNNPDSSLLEPSVTPSSL